MQPGDPVVFTGGANGFYSGEVLYPFHNPAMAERLWGRDTQDR